MSAILSKPWEARLASVGDWLAANQKTIRRVQWGVVGGYLILLVVPALLPLPGNDAFLWNNLTRFAQFVFWGLWWPGVILDGIALPWLTQIKWVALPLSVLWCAHLGHRVARRYHPSRIAAAACATFICLAASLVAAASLGALV